MNQIIQNIKKRRSIRKFKAEQIKESELQEILEAARFAPSAMNRQPWHFTVIQNKDLIDEISHKTKENMKKNDSEYVRNMAENEKFHLFYHSPTVIVISGLDDFKWSLVDCSSATQTMILAAESLDIATCWIGLVYSNLFAMDIEEWTERLGVPEGYSPLYAVSVGYKDFDLEIKIPERNQDVVNYIR